MKQLSHWIVASQAIFIGFIPHIALAQDTFFDFPHIIGLFNIFIGFMLTAAFLFFGGGFVMYIVRLGTVHREQGIRVMERGVIVLFVLVVLIALVQFFQSHPVYAAMLLSGIITVAIILTVIFLIATQGDSGEKKKEK